MVAVVPFLRRKDGKTEGRKDGMVYSDGDLTTAEAAARLSVGKPTFRSLGIAFSDSQFGGAASLLVVTTSAVRVSPSPALP